MEVLKHFQETKSEKPIKYPTYPRKQYTFKKNHSIYSNSKMDSIEIWRPHTSQSTQDLILHVVKSFVPFVIIIVTFGVCEMTYCTSWIM